MVIRFLMLAAIPVFTWAGVACLLGVRRFRYTPLAIPATGYFSWVSSFLMFAGLAGPLSLPRLLTALALGAVGGGCIVWYGLTFNRKMKALGITPMRILGLRRDRPAELEGRVRG